MELIFKAVENRKSDVIFDAETDHTLAREVAENSMVLLKNHGILPLDEKKSEAFIGAFAKKPRIQGGGSSNINCIKIVSALEAAETAGLNVAYAPGYHDNGSIDGDMLDEAVRTAKTSFAAVLFIGLPNR